MRNEGTVEERVAEVAGRARVAATDLAIATRAGTKTVRAVDGGWAVDLGPWRVVDPATAQARGGDAGGGRRLQGG